MNLDIVVLKAAQRELRKAPLRIRTDISLLFEELMRGIKLEMPVSKPLFNIAKGLYELRLNYKDGIYRVFYQVIVRDAIYVLHAGFKKTQKIDHKTRMLILTRIRSIT